MRNKNVLVITNWSYRDALIQSYTLPYVRLIKENIPASGLIYLVTLEQESRKVNQANKERIKDELREQGIIWIDFNFSKFGNKAIVERIIQLIKLWLLCFRRNITYIHSWCTPAGVTGYLLSVLTGRELILDSFEPHAEPSVETGTWKANSVAYKLLFYFEKKQAKRAKAIIAASGFIGEYAKDKWGIELKNYFIKPALVDLEKFKDENKKNAEILKLYGLENKIICVYAGKLGGIYLEGEIFEFIKVCHDYWGDKFRFFMLTDTPRELIKEFCTKSYLDDHVVVSLFVDYKDLPNFLGVGDFALNPVKIVKSKRCCASIKDGEYWALGLPVAITNSVGDDVKIILDNDSGVVLDDLNKIAYLKAVEKIDSMLKNYSMSELYKKIRPLAEKHRNYEIARKIYKTIYGVTGINENNLS